MKVGLKLPVVLFLTWIATPAWAQSGDKRLSLELRVGGNIVPEGWTVERQPEMQYNAPWLHRVEGGGLLEVRLILHPSSSVHPYVGYRISKFDERYRDAGFWANIYSEIWSNRLERITNSSVEYETRSLTIGATYDAPLPLPFGMLFILGEVTRDRFTANTSIHAELTNLQENSGYVYPADRARVIGDSFMKTDASWGMGLGVGFKIRLDRFHLIPTWKYGVTSIPVTDRYSEHFLLFSGGEWEGVISPWLGQFKGKEVAIRSWQFSVGLQYALF